MTATPASDNEQAGAVAPGVVLTTPQAVPLSGPVAKAVRLVQEIFRRRAEKLKPRPLKNRMSLYASGIPDCARQGVYEFLNGTEKKQHDWTLEALFKAGNINEAAYKEQLRELGLDCVEDGAPLPDDMRRKFNIGGYIDWRMRWEGVRIPCECKMMSPMIFDKIDGLDHKVLLGGEITQDMIERGIRSMERFPWTRKYLRQITTYLIGLSEEVGMFALTDGRGAWKFVIIPLDYELGESVLKMAETIKKHVEANTYPDRILYDSEVCGRCAFAHICIPDIKADPRLKIVDNAQMAELLERREALFDKAKELEKIEKKIKAFFEGVKDGVFSIGDFVVTRKNQPRSTLELPEDVKTKYTVKKDSYRNKIERFAAPDAEAIYLEPRRILSNLDDE